MDANVYTYRYVFIYTHGYAFICSVMPMDMDHGCMQVLFLHFIKLTAHGWKWRNIRLYKEKQLVSSLEKILEE